MTPERAEAIMLGIVATMQLWCDELELIESMRPIPTPAVQHLIAQIQQSKMSLEQLMGRGPPG